MPRPPTWPLGHLQSGASGDAVKIHAGKSGRQILLTPGEWKCIKAFPKERRCEVLAHWIARAEQSPTEATAGLVGWYDETIAAGHWFSLNDVDAQRAAMLLCQFNPNDLLLEQAQRTTNDITGPRDLVRLLQRFEDLAKTDPKPRSLLQWLHTARMLKLRYHPWIDQYADAASLEMPAPPASAPASVANGEAQSGSAESLPNDPPLKRVELLKMFRELDGKRPGELGKKGAWGALAKLERTTGINDKNLGQMLDKAIEEKRHVDAWGALRKP